MPLFTDNIEQARLAYSALEQRAQAAEQRAQALQSALDNLNAAQPPADGDVALLRQRVLDLEGDKVGLRRQLDQALQTRSDQTVQNFIATLGLAVAIGEATMPDRVISSVAANLQTYITTAASAVGLRFFQPGVETDPSALSSTTFEIAKIPPQPGAPAPPHLYAVLEDKQSVYTDTFWSRFATSTQPPSQPSVDLVVAIATVLANTGGWNFAFLVQSATTIGMLEKSLASLVAAAVTGGAVTAYGAAVDSLLALTKALGGKEVPVAGDLFALAASLANTTSAARRLLP